MLARTLLPLVAVFSAFLLSQASFPNEDAVGPEHPSTTQKISESAANVQNIESDISVSPGSSKTTKLSNFAVDDETEEVSSLAETNQDFEGSPFLGAFISSLSMIIVSELGDKTFFIAAIMAMTHDKYTVFGGAIGALAVMTVLSAALGYTVPNLLPREYTQNAATLLFLFFGFKLLKEAYGMDPNEENEELREVEEELAEASHEENAINLEGGDNGDKLEKSSKMMRMFASTIFIQSFSMTFLAEWGDRSQIATIALATHKDPVGVSLGGILGHSICTGIAVIGGRMAATRISERAVALMGGILFLIFGVHNIIFGLA